MYDNDDNDKENIMQDESSYTVEGTITKVTFANISKTSRVKRFTMHLYLTTPDSPNEDLKFEKKPAFESDKQLQIGQRVAITAIKDEFSENILIVHKSFVIEWQFVAVLNLAEGVFYGNDIAVA